jgi:hypothetical protein
MWAQKSAYSEIVLLLGEWVALFKFYDFIILYIYFILNQVHNFI